MTDQEQELERQMRDASRRMVRYMDRGNMAAARRCDRQIAMLHKQRSENQIRRMEVERGLRT